jgi:hypothetical protein
MTAIGWILVLGAAGAYALLVFACWRAVKKGPYDWTDADHALLPGNHVPQSARSAMPRKGPAAGVAPSAEVPAPTLSAKVVSTRTRGACVVHGQLSK